MAWEWSHTQEAYDYARQQVLGLPVGRLCVIYSEWMTDWQADNWKQQLDAAEAHAHHLEHDILASPIWDKAEEQRTCDNGGFNAWICPSGCHTVPFSPPERSIPSDGYADGGEPYTDEELAVINRDAQKEE